MKDVHMEGDGRTIRTIFARPWWQFWRRRYTVYEATATIGKPQRAKGTEWPSMEVPVMLTSPLTKRRCWFLFTAERRRPWQRKEPYRVKDAP